MATKVLVLGGGIGGLTTAQELLEREGFEVTVYELKRIPGGKSRTIPVPNSGTGGRPDLPGEHGFRFVPAFYRHLPDSLKRIPYGDNEQGCYDNLTPTTRIELARYDDAPILVPSRFPRSLSDLLLILHDAFDPPTLGLEPGELEFFAARLWQVMTSCKQRRLHELENESWYTFTDAANKSAAYKTFLVDGLSRSLVAAQPELGSARTIGQVQVHLMFGVADPFTNSTDQVLNGPTSAQMLQPWIAHIRALGGTYRTEVRVTDFAFADGRIESVGLEDMVTKEVWRETADYYVGALPVEVMGPLVTPEMTGVRGDPSLASMHEIQSQVRWMNGMQFFLKEDVAITHGHCLYVDSPWAITSISEAQFWSSIVLTNYGDGEVKGILSVDISDWTTSGTYLAMKAEDCTLDQIAEEVWKELCASINVGGERLLQWDNVHSYFLDTDIVIPHPDRPHKDVNIEPLYINQTSSWDKRPQAGTGIENLLLAADYVQTNADLACMDSANEAGRRAVNAILVRTGSGARPCKIWDMDMPALLAPLRILDLQRFQRNEPWSANPFGRREGSGTWQALKTAIAKRGRRLTGGGTPANPPSIDPTALSLADDAYHLHQYEDAAHLFWYVEWWYFNFFDKVNNRGGMVTFAIANGADVDLLGVASLNAAVFDPDATGTHIEMDYHSIGAFHASSELANVDLAGSTVRVDPDSGNYEVKATTADGSISMELVYEPADEPQLLADRVRATSQWEISSWLVWMPSARVSGWMCIDGQRYDLDRVSGYHDHDWGIWFVPGNTWAWAAFNEPDEQVSFDVGLHAAFQKSTAYFRRGDLRLSFPQDNFQTEYKDWKHWKMLWKYPCAIDFSSLDETGQYKLEMTWTVQDTVVLWKYPLIVFEQTARFIGTLSHLEAGTWVQLESFDTIGFSEYTSEWFGGGPQVE